MSGGLVFMLSGVVNDTLIFRFTPDGAGGALDRPHVRPVDFAGRRMRGTVFVNPGGAQRRAAVLA